jgi:hypothetical protein
MGRVELKHIGQGRFVGRDAEGEWEVEMRSNSGAVFPDLIYFRKLPTPLLARAQPARDHEMDFSMLSGAGR